MARKAVSKQAKKGQQKPLDRRAIASVAPYLFVENWDHLVVDDAHVRMEVVSGWPSEVPLGWGERVMHFDSPVPVSLVLKRAEGEGLEANISRTIQDNRWNIDRVSESIMDRERRKYETEQASAAIDLLVRTNAKIYETYLYLKLSAPGSAELDDLTGSVRDSLRGAGLAVTPHFADQASMFWAASPFLMDDPAIEDMYNFSMPTTTVARGLLNRDNGLCDPSGVPLGYDDYNGKVVVDMLTKTPKRPNNNVSIVADSGQGKSALMNMLIVYYRTLYDCDVIINDVDSEYTHLTRELGGTVCRMDASSPMLLNPFEPRNVGSVSEATSDESQAGAVDTDDEVREARAQALQAKVIATHMPFLVQFLLKSFTLDPDRHKPLLEKACTWAYNDFGITNDMTFAEYLDKNPGWPTLADLYERIPRLYSEFPEAADDAKEIRRALMKAAPGGYDEHMWRRSDESIPTDTPLVCIDLSGLPRDSDALSAQYDNVLSWEWSLMRQRRYSGRPLIVFSDEFHAIARDPAAAERLKNAAQRARKYGAGWVFATQNISEIMAADTKKAGEVIIDNCAYRFFSKVQGDLKSQEMNNARYVKSLLNTTDDTMTDLQDAPRGRFIVKAGSEKETWVNVHIEPWMFDLFGKGGGE